MKKKARHCKERDKKLYERKAFRLNHSQKQELCRPAEKVADFVKANFKVEYALTAVVLLLHHLSFVYKKPQLALRTQTSQ